MKCLEVLKSDCQFSLKVHANVKSELFPHFPRHTPIISSRYSKDFLRQDVSGNSQSCVVVRGKQKIFSQSV